MRDRLQEHRRHRRPNRSGALLPSHVDDPRVGDAAGDRIPIEQLLILRGARDESEKDFGVHYYLFAKGKFVHLRTLLVRARSAN